MNDGTYTGNSGYGIYAEPGAGGSVNFTGLQTYGGNGLGNVFVNQVDNGFGPFLGVSGPCPTDTPEGTNKEKPEYKPLKIVEVSGAGGESAELDCGTYAGTVLILPNGDHATFKCPIAGSGSLRLLGKQSVPGSLPEGVEFVSGFNASQSPDGSDKPLNGAVVVSFAIPDNMKGEDLAILYWDESGWVEQSGFVSSDGLYFQAYANLSGVFVLVSR